MNDHDDRRRVRVAYSSIRRISKPAEFSSPLEPWEDQLMACLCNGGTIQEFSDAQGLSANTAHNWTNKIRDRMGARTMFEAVHIWTMSKPGYVRLRRKAHGEIGPKECED